MRVVEGTAVNTDSDLASVLSPLCGSPHFTLKNPGKEFQGGKVWFPKCGPWTSHTSITSDVLHMRVVTNAGAQASPESS